MKYSFYNDYSEGAHPKILQYIAENNLDQQMGYCLDEYCELGAKRIKKAFGIPEADVHFLPNGTAANIVGLASMLQPFEGVISPDSGHINIHEAGGLEAAGHKILWMKAPDGKLNQERIDGVLADYEDEHTVLPRAIYLTQATELGTVYTKEELVRVITYAQSKNLLVYLDGARLPMALTSKVAGITPREFGKLRLDMFYVGGTKNGGLGGEAVVIQNNELKEHFRHHMKQRGALMAKGRFMGQQFARLLDEDNLWLTLATHANKMAERLYEGLLSLGIEFDLKPEANLVFPTMDNLLITKLQVDYGFYNRIRVDDKRNKIRLVCSWATQEENIDDFIYAVKRGLVTKGHRRA